MCVHVCMHVYVCVCVGLRVCVWRVPVRVWSCEVQGISLSDYKTTLDSIKFHFMADIFLLTEVGGEMDEALYKRGGGEGGGEGGRRQGED